MLSEFAKEKVFWTRKMNLKLVYFMKNKPNIWNPKHPKYTSIEERDQTYAEFADQYDDKFTGQAVKNRWTNIRSTFANYLRKLTASRAKGEDYKINWHLWDHCQFLMKVNKTAKDTLQDSNGIKKKKNPDSKQSYTSDDDVSGNNFMHDTEQNYCKEIAENMYRVFKAMQNDAFGLDNTNFGEVGQMVTKKLAQMNSFEASEMTKKITEILWLYDEHNPLNPNNLNI